MHHESGDDDADSNEGDDQGGQRVNVGRNPQLNLRKNDHG